MVRCELGLESFFGQRVWDPSDSRAVDNHLNQLATDMPKGLTSMISGYALISAATRRTSSIKLRSSMSDLSGVFGASRCI